MNKKEIIQMAGDNNKMGKRIDSLESKNYQLKADLLILKKQLLKLSESIIIVSQSGYRGKGVKCEWD